MEERRLRSIIEQLADGVVIVGTDGIIRFANPAAELLFARSARRLVGTQFGFPIVSGAPFEIDVIRPAGQIVTAELRVVKVIWEGRPARLVSIRDVTERRRAQERARHLERERVARAQAEAANQAKREFLATMSHELRTPINAIIGYSHLLDLGIGGDLSEEQRQRVQRILASSHHLLGLVNEVLDLAKVDAGRLAVQAAAASTAGTADAASALVQPLAESRGIVFTTHGAADRTSRYEGDEDRARQILVNLLTNALKFTERGGAVSLEYGQTATPDSEARLRSGGLWAYFTVTDSGIGIPADHLSRIFEPFVQVESGHTRQSDGSGLGLAISRRLARLMYGDITVRSTPGKGSVFTLWLPAASEEHKASAVRDEAVRDEPDRASRCGHGLADVGEVLLRELKPVLEAFVARVRAECPSPGADRLKFFQVADHVASHLADLARVLIALEEVADNPSGILTDPTDIQRLVALRHGAQRARLGWTEEAISCEYRILREELERAVRRHEGVVGSAATEEALGVVERLLGKAERTSLRAFAQEGRSSRGD